MSFKSLTDNQILALAIDEWLMELDDDEWEKAIRHIEKRKRQHIEYEQEQIYYLCEIKYRLCLLFHLFLCL